jgi:hypothetical protein
MVEAPVQQAWAQVAPGSVFTTCEGQDVTVLQPGMLQHSDGPDFTGASIRIGNATYFGDIEIHVRCSDWFRHGHQADPAYNRVILHVVALEKGIEPVLKENGQFVTGIHFLPVSYRNPDVLPCKPFWNDRLLPHFQTAMAGAKASYFEMMLVRAFAWIPPGAPPAHSFHYMAAGVAAEILGGAQNRGSLTTACLAMLENRTAPDALPWKSRSNRPATSRRVRVAQIETFITALRNTPIEVLLGDPEQSWHYVLSRWNTKPGADALATLRQLAWLPSLHVLAGMLHFKSLQLRILEIWKATEHPVPSPLRKTWHGAPVNTAFNTGLVHLYKRYCSEKRCQSCDVWKAAIEVR